MLLHCFVVCLFILFVCSVLFVGLLVLFDAPKIWAIGRVPNTDIGLDKAGVRVNEQGYIIADEYQNTTYVIDAGAVVCVVIVIVVRSWSGTQ